MSQIYKSDWALAKTRPIGARKPNGHSGRNSGCAIPAGAPPENNHAPAAYKTADGKVKVLITGNGPGASEAEITVADCDNLRSRYGKTESLGGGKYRFKGADICSDVLEK